MTFFTVLFCLTSSVGWSLTIKDLVVREGLYYKKFSDVPFSGKISGYNKKGAIVNGVHEGAWVHYWSNGQLYSKGNWKNGKEEGAWVYYGKEGTLNKKISGIYKNGVKISD